MKAIDQPNKSDPLEFNPISDQMNQTQLERRPNDSLLNWRNAYVTMVAEYYFQSLWIDFAVYVYYIV